ncbi:hypothetical protein KEM56_002539 [Ascosphaera pollenicola]|nr:hypothetical protein KEM56_002539 [Ascosphaera pollenicola]
MATAILPPEILDFTTTTTAAAASSSAPASANPVSAQAPTYRSQHQHQTEQQTQQFMPPSNMAKKQKAKKTADPSETSKLLAAKISQLEQDAAGEKDQEIEIEREVKKATRDLNQLLSNIESPMTRLETVQRKYTELLAEMKKLDREYAKSKKRGDQLQKEQEKSKSELGKTATMKDKLEKLCRELTKENKKVKDENKRLEETEQRARRIVNERLDSLLFGIQDVMAAKSSARSDRVDMELDAAIRIKLKNIGDRFEAREQHYKSLLRVKDIEVQCLQAKCEEYRRAAERETAKTRELNERATSFSATEAELRAQLNIYVEKFKQVEDTLNNSNELFMTFRKEMEEMSKKTKKLEKENQTLTRKHDQTNRNIIEMAEERTRAHEEIEKWRKKSNSLEALCRRMQEQGRGQRLAPELHPEDEEDDEGTESDYEDDYEEEEDISEEGGYDDLDDDDQDYHHHHHNHNHNQHRGHVPPPPAPSHKPVFGPPPPPQMLESRANGNPSPNDVNGIRH